VQFYAKATALAPEEAALHLVLADALFATGDYHYAAYSIRRALELDPKLAETSVDKHAFYSDPSEFDAQLARLEAHCEAHPEDADARLVLATNQLFGRRPGAAVSLLERSQGPAAGVSAADPAVELILAAARKAQPVAPPAPPQEPQAPPEEEKQGD
jgi:Flp pilus assembly protein TadD